MTNAEYVEMVRAALDGDSQRVKVAQVKIWLADLAERLERAEEWLTWSGRAAVVARAEAAEREVERLRVSMANLGDDILDWYRSDQSPVRLTAIIRGLGHKPDAALAQPTEES